MRQYRYLQDIICDGDLPPETYDVTRALAVNALFSRYPQRRVYSRRKLNELWDIHTNLVSLRRDETAFIFLNFGSRTQFFVCAYPCARIGFEVMPTAAEIDDWTRYL